MIDKEKIVKILQDTETWNDPCEYCQKSSNYCDICVYEDYADRLLRSGAVAVVVRCKDCIHRDKAGLCQAEGQKLTIVKDNHFCGKGERKDGNEECLNT